MITINDRERNYVESDDHVITPRDLLIEVYRHKHDDVISIFWTKNGEEFVIRKEGGTKIVKEILGPETEYNS